MTGVGLLLKYTVGKSSSLVQETMAIAVPFLYIRGEPQLGTEGQPDKGVIRPGAISVDPDFIGPMPSGEKPENPLPGPGSTIPLPGPEFERVEESYFDDVLFVGDSRIEGLKLYARLGKADYFANQGMSVFNLFEKTLSDNGFSEQTLSSLLHQRKYKVIYLSLGINEMGYPHASLEKQYAEAIQALRSLAPDSYLVLMGNLGVTRSKAEGTSYLSLENVKFINNLIASFADNKTIFYIDPSPPFSDAEGYLLPEMTGDGVHPYATGYRAWSEWLKDYGLIIGEKK